MRRPCLDCDALIPLGRPRCPTCTRNRERRRRRTAARGYGGAHQRTAAALRARYPAGPCGLCGKPGSWTDATDPLQAGHVVAGGRLVRPEHRGCNVAEANRRNAGRGEGR